MKTNIYSIYKWKTQLLIRISLV